MDGHERAERIVRADDALWHRVPHGVIAMARSGGDALLLRGLAVALWELLASPCSLDDLTAEIVGALGEEAASSLPAAIDGMERAGLVRAAEPQKR